MERILNRHIWVVELLFVAGMAAEFAGIAGVLAVRGPAPHADELAALGPSRRPRALESAALGSAFGLRVGQEAAAPPELTTQAPVSPLHAELRATTLANRPEWSLAILRDLDAKSTGIVLVGDVFMGAEVVAIEVDRVRVQRGDRFEEIAMGLPPAPEVRAPLPGAGPPQSTPIAFTRQGTNVTLTEEARQNALAHPEQFAGDARFFPAIENGTMSGFKLASIRPDGIFPKLGLQAGDVVRRVDGLALDSAEGALQALNRVRSERHIEVEIQRGGRPVVLTVEVQ